MKVAVVCLLACCLIVLVLILLALRGIHDNDLTAIIKILNNLVGYKHDDLYFKLAEIRDDIHKIVEMKKPDKNAEKVKPDPPDALIIEPCPVCGFIPAMYRHTELDSYCVRCSGWSRSKYDGNCSCSICVISDSKVAAMTAWNDAVNDYIMHKNKEDKDA